MRLLIVIVNYKTAGLVVDCLGSLEGQVDPARDRVVVVDNGSGDGSHETVSAAIDERGWSGWAVAEEAPGNNGFAAGNNFGIGVGRKHFGASDFTLLLNPDTVVLQGAIDALLAFMEANPGCGIAGSRLENPDATPRRSAFRYATIASEFERGARVGLVTKLLKNRLVAPDVKEVQHETDWVAGASMMVRQAVFDRAGLMDDAYFLYYEETDFCLAAKRAGFSCWYVPESRVIHLVGQSTGVTGNQRSLKPLPAYWYQSRRRYFRKNHGWLYATLADLAWLTGHLIYLTKAVLTREQRNDPPQLLSGFVRHGMLGRSKAA